MAGRTGGQGGTKKGILRRLFERRPPEGQSRSGHSRRFVADYDALVAHLLKRYDRDEALLRAVGGNDLIGDSEIAILLHSGLADGSYLVDVGCGSGRLTRRAAKLQRLRYLGSDINATLLDEARRTAGRPDFRFELVDGIKVPERDGVADMVAFFSVGTHLLHEEFFVYLRDARRVLKPGGRIVLSFLDFQCPNVWTVFEEMLKVAEAGSGGGHLNMFIGHGDIRVWARHLDMAVIDVVPGDKMTDWSTEASMALLGHKPAPFAFGQSVAILEKPSAG